jgi:hypothetical protein
MYVMISPVRHYFSIKQPLLHFYLFPFALLCVLQSIWQFLSSVTPPLLQAATWSASISASFHILRLLASWPSAHSGQIGFPLVFAGGAVCSIIG